MQNTAPIAKDANVSLPLGHVVGEPFPDKIQVVAAIWADGSIFGDPARLKLILANRAGREKSYDSAVSLLQKGLPQSWTRDQYIEALNQRKKEAPLLDMAGPTMESNLTRNPSLDSPANLERTVRYLVEIFTQRRATLRQTKPRPDLATSSN